MSRIITVLAPPGLGDAAWILNKLEKRCLETDTKIDLKTYERWNVSSPLLGKLDIINSVSEWQASYDEYMEYFNFAKEPNNYTDLEDLMKIYPNYHLEQGNRIEDFLPAFDTTLKLKWNLDKDLVKQAEEKYIRKNVPNFVIYTSSLQNNIKQKFVNIWYFMINCLMKEFPESNIIYIGADYDNTMKEKIEERFGNRITYLVNGTSEEILTILRKCDYFISYQSGLSVLAVQEGVRSCMFYFKELDKLRYSWVPKNAIDNISLYHCPFFLTFVKEPEEFGKFLNMLPEIIRG